MVIYSIVIFPVPTDEITPLIKLLAHPGCWEPADKSPKSAALPNVEIVI